MDPDLATAFGVKRGSVLNTSKYFHVVEGLASDIMHDVLEGVIPKVTKLILVRLICDGHFSVDVLNAKIRNFTFGTTDLKNKPEPNVSQATLHSPETSLKQSGKTIAFIHFYKHVIITLGNFLSKQSRVYIWPQLFKSWVALSSG